MKFRTALAWLFVFSLLAVLPAGAQESDARAEAEAEHLRAARLAMEAKLKLGDLLREKGDLGGAARSYREALQLYEQAIERLRARDRAPDTLTDEPFKGPRRKPAVGIRAPVPQATATMNAVELGLTWLAAHQDVEGDGRWDCDEFSKHDTGKDRCDGSGGALYDVGVTGLSLLAFLGAGYTDRGSEKENPYGRNVRMGLRYLLTSQLDDGSFGTRVTYSFMYNHAMATLAMSEAYAATRNPRYKKPAQDGLNFIAMARNPYMAWRYEPRGGENDTSVTAWCTLALKSGKFAGLEVDPDAFAGVRQWIDKMTDPQFGQVGYNYPGGSPARPEGLQDKFPPEKSQAMTAAGIMTRILCGEDPDKSAMIKKGADLCLGAPPVWDRKAGTIDMYYWYYGTVALFQVGGDHWRKWNEHLGRAVLKSQHGAGSGARTGSWDPIGVWGGDGGRVYATALMTMCLEVYYRYDRALTRR
jgi:hypothetical protein